MVKKFRKDKVSECKILKAETPEKLEGAINKLMDKHNIIDLQYGVMYGHGFWYTALVLIGG